MKIDRLLSLVIHLLNHEKTTAVELSKVFETSVRTIYRDLDTLSLAGIPVLSRQGSGGGVSLMPQFRLDRQVFTSGELLALVSALRGVETALGDKNISQALEKVKTLAPAAGGGSEIEIDFSSWEDPEKFRAVLSLFYNAIRKHRVVRFEYVNLKGELRKRDVEPVRLFFRGSAWYLFGWCRSRKDYRFFRLGRIQSPDFTGEVFKEHKIDTLGTDYEQFWVRGEETEIVLRIPEGQRARLFGRLEESALKNTGDGCLEAVIHFPLDEWVYSWLMGIADVITVVSPAFVREELLRRAQSFITANRT
jgi:predicted DNA-binding transcriptional regulator YafY